MNRIQELIKELCPNGVEWKKLGEVCEIIAGGDVPNNTIKGAFFDDEHRYPIYSNGVGINSLYGFTDSYRIDKESVTISARGTIGWHCVRKPNFTPIVRLITLVPYDVIIAKYLDAVLNVVNIEGSKGGIPQLTIPNVRNLQIPLPPLPVQTEIVRILDKFVEQQEQLEKLIELRTKQYEYYREEMLTFDSSIQRFPVKEVCDYISNFAAAGSFALVSEKVPYLSEPDYAQLVRTTDLKHNFKNADQIYISKESYEFLWRVNLDKASIILPSVGNCGEVYYVEPEMLPYPNNALAKNAFLVRSTKANLKYLKYIFESREYKAKLAKIANDTGQGKFNKGQFEKILIPLVLKEEQNKIVTILDSFESSISALTSALELSKKRYEHYRDKMLKF